MSDSAFPILTVRDLPATARFYTRLGFAETYRFPGEGEPEFVTLQRNGSTLGLGSEGPEGERFAYWVYVDDVDASLADLRESGVEVVEQPADEPWGERVASVRDPAGNLLFLGAPSEADTTPQTVCSPRPLAGEVADGRCRSAHRSCRSSADRAPPGTDHRQVGRWPGV